MQGIIPAHAGNTVTRVRTSPLSRDHPRVCGEHSTIKNSGSCVLGSSPRMRGTPKSTAKRAKQAGIIPAYAGNTDHRHAHYGGIRDHPRVCGEHAMSFPYSNRSMGSSPRMRGTRAAGRDEAEGSGIIPAYAGNTRAAGSPSLLGRDHPRVCGEHTMNGIELKPCPGSSPRMRGTPHSVGHRISVRGIIPAYAGNTVWHKPRSPTRRDHPRVCGEHKTRIR